MRTEKRIDEATRNGCAKVSFGECFCGRAASTRQIQFADCNNGSCEARCKKAGPHYHYSVPILFAGDVLGVIGIRLGKGHRRGQKEVKFLPGVANILGGIIKRKRIEEYLLDKNHCLEDMREELRQTRKQVVEQERLREVGQMTGGIAHDLNNVLQPVLGYSDLLLMHPETLDNKARTLDHLKSIRTAAEDATNVIHRLGVSSRVPGNNDASKPVDLNKSVREAILFTKPKWIGQAQEGGSDIRFETDLQTVPFVEWNVTELRELLTNLIFNAVDAMPDGGTITIGTSYEDKHVVVRISDTGTGMSEDVRRRCMDPFFSTKGEQGTGMGLWMARGIVERANGGISVESTLGKGTTVVVRLKPQRKGSKRSAPDGKERPLHSLRVFLVDDDPEVRNLVSEYLTGDGHEVDTAANGQEGIEKFHADRFDVVITDQAMPKMNGSQFATAIKKTAPDKPIILLTGFGNPTEAQDKHPDNMSCVLTKPVAIAQLRRALATVVEEPRTSGGELCLTTDAKC